MPNDEWALANGYVDERGAPADRVANQRGGWMIDTTDPLAARRVMFLCAADGCDEVVPPVAGTLCDAHWQEKTGLSRGAGSGSAWGARGPVPGTAQEVKPTAMSDWITSRGGPVAAEADPEFDPAALGPVQVGTSWWPAS